MGIKRDKLSTLCDSSPPIREGGKQEGGAVAIGRLAKLAKARKM